MSVIVLIIYLLIKIGLEVYFMIQLYKNARNKDLCTTIADAVIVMILFIGL